MTASRGQINNAMLAFEIKGEDNFDTDTYFKFSLKFLKKTTKNGESTISTII